LTSTSSLSSGPTSVAIVASTMKVPLPCNGTATWLSMPLATASKRRRSSAVRSIKTPSREPKSRSMARLVARRVVSGPGVSSICSVMAYFPIYQGSE